MADWSLWVRATLTAITLVFVPRMIGLAGLPDGALPLFLHSAIHVLAAVLFMGIGTGVLQRLVPGAGRVTVTLAGCVAGAVPSALIGLLACWMLGIGIAGPIETREAFLGRIPGLWLQVFAVHAGFGTLIWGILFAGWFTLPSGYFSSDCSETPSATDAAQGEQDNSPEEPAAHRAEIVALAPPLLKHLPQQKRGRLWAISAERRHVRVRTSKGEHVLLMRLSDAIAQCQAVAGLQVHRSHWVARDGVRDLVEAGGNMDVRLHDGTLIPVSRNRRSLARESLAPAT